jgi:hypothetical protein
VGDRPKVRFYMTPTLVFLGALAVRALLAVELSLKGVWQTNSVQVLYCDTPARLGAEQLSLEIQAAPIFNSAVSPFNYRSANVIGYLAMRVHLDRTYPKVEHSYPDTLISGVLVGEILQNARIASTAAVKPVAMALTLKGYIVSPKQYGAWLQSEKLSPPPNDAGEVELKVSGNPVEGYTLTGIVRSGETCIPGDPMDGARPDLTRNLDRRVPSKWSAHVTLGKK